MFPNPQDALPLPARPEVESYEALARELAAACESDALGAWAERWLDSLQGSFGQPDAVRLRREVDRCIQLVERYALETLTGGARQCVLDDARLVLARSHGFDGWARWIEHVEALARADSSTARFESAAEAIVAGDEKALQRSLAADAGLVRARSTREHRATLLHYVSANGVENWRQKTPANIVRIAELLLDAGAEVDAEADVYGGGATTLGLVATSTHPRAARVQVPLMELLIDRGARFDRPDAGSDQGTVMACLDNGCPEAARYLAERGARLGLDAAAGVGRMDLVEERVGAGATKDELGSAFRYACGYGRTEIALHLVSRGADLANHGGDGQTGLHYAVIGGHLATVEALLPHGPPLEARNMYGGTVLGQALWSAAHGGEPETYARILEALLAAGAQLADVHPPVNERIDALLARHGSRTDPDGYWFGEAPRKRMA